MTARLEAATVFDVYDHLAERVLLRITATFTNVLSLPLSLGSPPYLRYHQSQQRISETGVVSVAIRRAQAKGEEAASASAAQLAVDASRQEDPRTHASIIKGGSSGAD